MLSMSFVTCIVPTVLVSVGNLLGIAADAV